MFELLFLYKNMITKEEFLERHNDLASLEMRATMKMLDFFETKKPALFKDGNYSIEKIRRPFIFWITSLNETEKKRINKAK